MNLEWQDKNDSFWGYPCLTHRDDMNRGVKGALANHEKAIFGERGQILEYSSECFSVIKYANNNKELILRKIPRSDFRKWVGLLGLPASRTKQVALSEAFRGKGRCLACYFDPCRCKCQNLLSKS